MTMVDHLSIVRSLRFRYAAPPIDPEWVRQCIQALVEDGQQATVDAVHEQFLWSNLTHSTLPSETVPRASSSQSTQLFKDPTLLQVESITEIGASAFHLQNTVNQRRDVIEGRTRIRRIDDPADGEEVDEANMPVYPRSMLKLELSDGRTKIKAIEYKRLQGLKLGDTPLGCKLVLQGVQSRHGILLLQPSNTEVAGGMVEDLEATQAESFIASLKARMDDANSGPRRQTAPRQTRPRAVERAPPPAITPATRPRATARAPQTPVRPVPDATPSSRPHRAARQDANARIERIYEQTAMVDRQIRGPSTRRPPVAAPEDEFDDFEMDDGFIQHVSALEARGPAQVYELDSDDYGDDLAVDDSFIRQVDAVEARSQRVGRRDHVQSDTESGDMDSGKENRPIVIDSD